MTFRLVTPKNERSLSAQNDLVTNRRANLKYVSHIVFSMATSTLVVVVVVVVEAGA